MSAIIHCFGPESRFCKTYFTQYFIQFSIQLNQDLMDLSLGISSSLPRTFVKIFSQLFDIFCIQTDKRTDKQSNRRKNTQTAVVRTCPPGRGKNSYSEFTYSEIFKSPGGLPRRPDFCHFWYSINFLRPRLSSPFLIGSLRLFLCLLPRPSSAFCSKDDVTHADFDFSWCFFRELSLDLPRNITVSTLWGTSEVMVVSSCGGRVLSLLSQGFSDCSTSSFGDPSSSSVESEDVGFDCGVFKTISILDVNDRDFLSEGDGGVSTRDGIKISPEKTKV